jgi:hypothetical protein
VSGEQLSEHVLQDSAMLVVVDFVGRVDPAKNLYGPLFSIVGPQAHV